MEHSPAVTVVHERHTPQAHDSRERCAPVRPAAATVVPTAVGRSCRVGASPLLEGPEDRSREGPSARLE